MSRRMTKENGTQNVSRERGKRMAEGCNDTHVRGCELFFEMSRNGFAFVLYALVSLSGREIEVFCKKK